MLLQWALRDAQARAALSKANFSFAEDIAVPETDATNGTSTIASAVSEAEVAVGGAGVAKRARGQPVLYPQGQQRLQSCTRGPTPTGMTIL